MRNGGGLKERNGKEKMHKLMKRMPFYVVMISLC